MNERTTGSPAAQSRSGGNSKVVGDYLHKIEEVPKEVRDYAINKLNPVDAAGERIKDAQGNHITARISTAKENGSYYGPVVLNNDKFIVQAVGKDRISAIVHHKDDVALQGASLALLDAKKTMNGTNVQIHYTEDKAKAYHWSDKSKQVAESGNDASVREAARDAMKPEDFMQKAANYAKENIKNTNQREAFLKHLGNVTEQAFNKQQPEVTKTKATPAPAQAKQADNGIER
jgi:monoamine oxidase